MGLREAYNEKGEKRFTRMMIEGINDGTIKTNGISLKHLWESMGCPVLRPDPVIGENFADQVELTEAVGSSMFPQITGALINKTIQDAYLLESGMGEQLVTTIPSSQKDDTIVGIIDDAQMEHVEELMEYEEGGLGEKYHKIRNRKFGRILSISEETVKFDQTQQILNRARMIGQNARAKKEEIIFDAILEKTTSGLYAAWRPGGTSTALYSSTSTDPYSDSTLDNSIVDTLADETDIDAALAQFETFKDEHDQSPIIVNPTHILTGYKYASVAQKIFGSTGSVVLTASNSIPNTMRGVLQPVVSAWVAATKGNAYWLVGDFKKQFYYTEVFPVQVLQRKPGGEDEYKRDALYSWKTRFMGGCGAVTNRYVVMSTGNGS